MGVFTCWSRSSPALDYRYLLIHLGRVKKIQKAKTIKSYSQPIRVTVKAILSAYKFKASLDSNLSYGTLAKSALRAIHRNEVVRTSRSIAAKFSRAARKVARATESFSSS